MNRKRNAYKTHGLQRTVVRRIASWCALLALLLTGCQKEIGQELPDAGGVIRVYTDIEGSAAEPLISPDTRAAATQARGLTGAQFLKKDGTSAPSNFSGVTPVAGNVIATTGAVAFTGAPPQYALNNQNAYMVGYFPVGTLASNVVTWNINGATDILLSPVWDAGKYTAANNGAGATRMTFKHCLAQLEVVCKADPTADIKALQGVWGNITSIELLQTPAQMKYSYATNTATAAAKADKALLKADYNTAFAAIAIPASNNTTVNAAGMYAPSIGIFSVRVKTTKVPTGITLAVQFKNGTTNADFIAGRRHTITLTFLFGNVAATCSIGGWLTGSDQDNDVGNPPVGGWITGNDPDNDVGNPPIGGWITGNDQNNDVG